MKKLLIIAAAVLLSGCIETTNGVKVGTLVKCAKEGLLIKTFECEIIRGGMTDGSGSIGKSFHFTIENTELQDIARQALDHQNQIKLTYHNEWITLWRTETDDNAFGDKIEVL